MEAFTPDPEAFVWSKTEDGARRFFGVPDATPVRVVKERPETTEEKERHKPGLKLFAVTMP